MNESDFISAINAAPDDRTLQLIYADWLDGLDDPRAEAWRVLVEQGKRPEWSKSRGVWQWYYSDICGVHGVEDVLPGTDIMIGNCPLRNCLSYFEAMDGLAIAWVRHHRDADFMREPSGVRQGHA